MMGFLANRDHGEVSTWLISLTPLFKDNCEIRIRVRLFFIAGLQPLNALLFVGVVYFLSSCRVSSTLATLPPDVYWVTDKTNPKPTHQKAYAIDSGDSIQLINPVNDRRQTLPKNGYQRFTFRHTKLDIDAFTIPFKVRSNQGNVPPQYDTDFNAAFYIGQRINSYTYQWKNITPSYAIRKLRNQGFSYGLFFGAGATNMSNDVTRSPINLNYQGVIFDAGVATIYDAGLFNYGLAVGVDHLVDINRQNWIYHHKPWFGILFGLNLN